MTPETFDCAVIGGGAAGLTAATYLGRFRRSVAVFDDGRSRVLDIPRSRNVPGYPDGVAGHDLHARMLAQARRYGMRLIEQRVTSISRDEDEFTVNASEGSWKARAVIIATGIDVVRPDVPDVASAVARGLVRYCPICDGYECAGKRVGVFGSLPKSLEEAIFLRTYADDVTLIPSGQAFTLSSEQRERAAEFAISVEERPAQSLQMQSDSIKVSFATGSSETFDVIYPCLGSRPRSELASSLGAEVTPTGGLLVDSRQQTNVPMLYAAGDVLEGLDQIASGWGQAAIAATAIHNMLRPR